MADAAERTGEVGHLVRRLVAAHVPRDRQASALRIAARLMESSLASSPGLQTAESLSHTMLFRLVREGRHSESTQLAELTAGLRFERGLKPEAIWPVLYVLNDLRGSANEMPKYDKEELISRKKDGGHQEDELESSPPSTEIVGEQPSFPEEHRRAYETTSLPLVSANPFTAGVEPDEEQDDGLVPESRGDYDDDDDSDDDDGDFFLMERASKLSASSRSRTRKKDPGPMTRKEGASREKLTPLENLSLEKKLVRDLLLVVQGEEGQYLAFQESSSEAVTVNMPAGTALTVPVRDMTMYVSEVGFLFRIIRQRVEEKEEESGGFVAQNMCNAIVCEMDSYYRSIVALRSVEKFSGDYDEDDPGSLTLRKMYCWSEMEKPKLRWLARLCEETRGLKGGQILRHLRQQRRLYLPADIHDMMSRILASTSAPINRMLQRWLSEGILVDPHHEFFVMEDPKVAASSKANMHSAAALIEEVGVSGGLAGGPNGASVASHRIWWGLYKIRGMQLPGSVDMKTAEAALKAGKSIAFLRRCCSDTAWVDREHAPLVASLSSSSTKLFEADSRFEVDAVRTVIEAAKSSASKRLKTLFFDRFDLSHHFGAIKNYLLLSQGDFSQALMDGLAPILDGGADILRNNLTGIVDAALQGCSSFNDETDQDILERLDVQIAANGTDSDVGWDVFSLTYRVEDAPLNTVFSTKVMQAYLLIFRLLWRLKRMDHLMSLGYMSLCAFDDERRRQGRDKGDGVWYEVRKVARRAHYLRMKMTQLVQNMQHYCTVEVLEGSWTVLERNMNEAEDLDGMIEAHSVYLTRIKDRTLLSRRSEYVACELDAVLKVIPEFDEAQRELCRWTGRVGSAVDDEKVRDMAEWMEGIEERFNESFDRFLAALRKHCKMVDTCVFLLFRLDFNEHYTRRKGLTRAAASPDVTGSGSR